MRLTLWIGLLQILTFFDVLLENLKVFKKRKSMGNEKSFYPFKLLIRKNNFFSNQISEATAMR